jgi:hypothetical protein
MVKPDLERQEAEGTALMPAANAIAIITEPEKFEQFYSTIVDEISGFTPDLTTAMGRAEIAKMARKVAKTKTFLDATGKALNDDARKQIGLVDASRRAMRERLDKLRDEVRKPLTEWEEQEDKRQQHVEAKFLWFRGALSIPLDSELADVEEYRADLSHFVIREETFGDRTEEARDALTDAIEAVNLTIARIEKSIADAAELKRLQDAEAERQRKADEEAAELRASAIREQQEAEVKERAEAARKAEAKRVAEAEERARAEERQKAEEKANAAIAAEREAKEKVEREVRERRERERLDAAEAAQRARNKKHRAEVELAATLAIATAGQIERVDAKLIVEAIVAGAIPHVTLEF